jgi:hypothetical protein
MLLNILTQYGNLIRFRNMKTYIVYVNGNEVGYIKAANHNAAEKKAFKKYNGDCRNIQVVYTEL